MNGKYFFYALCVTIFSTILSWGSMFASMGSSGGGGSSWSSGSSGYGGSSGGGHK